MRFLSACFLFVLAVCSATGQTTIVDEIQKDEFGKGKVRIYQDPSVFQMIGSREDDNNSYDKERKHLRVPGYRVQVFSGNNQRTSKGEAFAKEQQVKRMHSDINTYVTYRSPFWRLRVGDFRTYEEAFVLMRQLMKEFPDFGKEMYVIKEDVIISL